MSSPGNRDASRRAFLRFLAASPLLATSIDQALAEEGLKIPLRAPDPFPWAPRGSSGLITRPQDAIDVFDFEPVAHQNVPPAHFGFMATGADDDVTLRANREDFGKYAIRGRRLRKVSTIDTSIELFGTKWASPIFISPAGGNKAFHPEGEIALSKAAEAGNHLQMLSTGASVSLEDAMKARNGTPIWFQVYTTSNFEVAKALVARAERAGSPAIAITVDVVAWRKNGTQTRLTRTDTRDCSVCHPTSAGTGIFKKPAFSHIDPALLKDVNVLAGNVDWDFVRRLRDTTKMKVVIKGIMDPEDAALCVKYGFDGVYVSNHGGRNDDAGASSISVVSDVVAAVRGKIPVLVDSGFRRGMDVVKALAMGVTAVGIGRPYLWGLGAFGQPGVERVLEILRMETNVAMASVGAATVKDLVPTMIHRT